MKKTLAFLLALVMLTTTLVGCGNAAVKPIDGPQGNQPTQSGTPSGNPTVPAGPADPANPATPTNPTGGNQPTTPSDPNEETKPTEHKHSYSSTVTKATCEQMGITTYNCACGDSYTADLAACLGHNYQPVGDAKTTTDTAAMSYTCTVCNHTYTDSLGLQFKQYKDGTYYVDWIGQCKDLDIYIPKYYNGELVTGIGARAFEKAQINSVTIPDSVTTIGANGFYKSTLAKVIIPSSITAIYNYAFMYCNNLISV